LRGELRQYQLQVAPPSDGAEVARIRKLAEDDLRGSLMGHPAPARPLRMLSELAGSEGRMTEALEYGMRAYEQDPFMEQAALVMFRLFEYSFALKQDATAARWCGDGRRRFPEQPFFDDCRLALAAWSDDYPLSLDSASTVMAAELSAYPEGLRPSLEPRLHAMMAAILARRGMRDSARVVLRNARGRDSSPGVLRAAAGVHGVLKEPDSALATLRVLLDRAPTERRALQSAIELRTVVSDPRARVLIQPR
jgi:hypothetical protein